MTTTDVLTTFENDIKVGMGIVFLNKKVARLDKIWQEGQLVLLVPSIASDANRILRMGLRLLCFSYTSSSAGRTLFPAIRVYNLLLVSSR